MRGLLGLCLLLLTGIPQASLAEGTRPATQSLSAAPASLPRLDLASVRSGDITGQKRSCAAAAPQTCTAGEDAKVAQYGGCVCCFINGCGCMPVNVCYGQRGVCRGPC